MEITDEEFLSEKLLELEQIMITFKNLLKCEKYLDLSFKTYNQIPIVVYNTKMLLNDAALINTIHNFYINEKLYILFTLGATHNLSQH